MARRRRTISSNHQVGLLAVPWRDDMTCGLTARRCLPTNSERLFVGVHGAPARSERP